MKSHRSSRRKFVAGTAVGALGAVAGCVGFRSHRRDLSVAVRNTEFSKVEDGLEITGYLDNLSEYEIFNATITADFVDETGAVIDTGSAETYFIGTGDKHRFSIPVSNATPAVTDYEISTVTSIRPDLVASSFPDGVELGETDSSVNRTSAGVPDAVSLSGSVVNTGEEVYYDAGGIIKFHDSNDYIIGTDYDITAELQPGESYEFELRLSSRRFVDEYSGNRTYPTGHTE